MSHPPLEPFVATFYVVAVFTTLNHIRLRLNWGSPEVVE